MEDGGTQNGKRAVTIDELFAGKGDYESFRATMKERGVPLPGEASNTEPREIAPEVGQTALSSEIGTS